MWARGGRWRVRPPALPTSWEAPGGFAAPLPPWGRGANLTASSPTVRGRQTGSVTRHGLRPSGRKEAAGTGHLTQSPNSPVRPTFAAEAKFAGR